MDLWGWCVRIVYQNFMDMNIQKTRSSGGPAWPVAHLLALAPLDVWIRMLIRSGGVKPRYWVRLGFILMTSFVGTIATVHERMVLAVIRRRLFGVDAQINHRAVIIVGYYRSGTTHLQNLMSCDARFVTPKWYQCLAGQGFWLGWSIIRFVLVPFLGTTRPQDSVGFGPSWPAEDDFALCTSGGCSSIPGRFIWPSKWDNWKRWHGLEGLSDKELNRWRSLMAMFVWKMTRGKNKSKVLLLKTPSHTARIAELDRLFKGDVSFVHLVREPTDVIDSNVRLHASLNGHLLEKASDVQTVRQRIVEEYAETEEKCCEESKTIGSGRFIRVRYQDLRADGCGTMRKVYDTLGLKWDTHTELAVQRYLGSLGVYSSAKEEIELGAVNKREEEVKSEMIRRYRLDDEPACRVKIEHVADSPAKIWRGFGSAALIANLCALAWIGTVWGIHTMMPDVRMRFVPLVWVCGALIGMGAKKASGTGARSVGIFAAALTVLVVVGVSFPVTVINWNWASGEGYDFGDWVYHNAKGGFEGIRSVASVIFILLGAATAYRHGSDCGPTAPGKVG
jgi:hypothetical protein